MFWVVLVAAYFAGMFTLAMWDAYIGFGKIEFDGIDWPPLGFAMIFWPVILPIVIVASFVKALEGVKERRIARQEERKKLRVAAQQEYDKAMQQIEEEMSYEAEDPHPRRAARGKRGAR